MSFLGGNGPKGTMRLVLLDTFVDYIVQPLLLSIKLQCTIVTKTIVNHLKPKTKKNFPHHSEYDTLGNSVLSIPEQSHIIFSVTYGKHWKSKDNMIKTKN